MNICITFKVAAKLKLKFNRLGYKLQTFVEQKAHAKL